MKIIDSDDKLFILSLKDMSLLKKVLEYYINKSRIYGGEVEAEKMYNMINEAMK